VWIVAIQEEVSSQQRTGKRIKEVIVADNGAGMSREVLNTCLQYGGGENGPKSKKMGKFGMGLPNASGSQSSRTEVYSWQGTDQCYVNHLDFDELEKQEAPEIPDAEAKQLPRYIRKLLPDLSNEHGTVVVWKNCDSLQHKTVAAFNRNLESFLGRVYRYWLHEEGCSIEFAAYERVGTKITLIPDYEARKIRVMDPLFLMTPNCIAGHEKEKLNEPHAESKAIETPNGKKYDVRIKYSLAKPEIQSREGKTGNLGTKVYQKQVGISLLRARRELKLHDFGFISDKNEYRHRWWSCEVEFGPELDVLFKVTNDKQEARGFRCLEKEDYQELRDGFEDEGLELMYGISKGIKDNIKTMFKIIKGRGKGSHSKTACPSCKKVAVQGNSCSECGYQLEFCPHHQTMPVVEGVCALCELAPPDVPDTMCTRHNVELVEGVCAKCDKSRTPLKKAEKMQLERHLEVMYPKFSKTPALLELAMGHFLQSGRSHFIIYVQTAGGGFVMPDKFGDVTLIAINTAHPFYDRFMRPMIEDRDEGNEIAPIHMLIGAMVHAEEMDLVNNEMYEEFREHFSINLKKLMRDYDIE
jgi:hypothetical protein